MENNDNNNIEINNLKLNKRYSHDFKLKIKDDLIINYDSVCKTENIKYENLYNTGKI